MGVCVTKLPHDECGSSDALQVFQDEDGTFNGWCFKCGTHVDDPFGGKEPPKVEVKTPEEMKQELITIHKEYPVAGIPDRKLRKDTLSYFGCRMEVSQQDGETPVAVMFPYGSDGEFHGYKVRVLAKKRMWSIGRIKPSKPFGWAKAMQTGQRTLYITEGEFDAMALYQILKDSNAGTQYANDNPAVISLKSGAVAAVKELGAVRKAIDRNFDQVVLVFDMDEPGLEAAAAVSKDNPTWKVAELPLKDANECLIKGASKACKSAVVFKSEVMKNSRILMASSLAKHARVAPEMGLSTPWDGLTEAMRGFRRQETIYWGAGVKMGKSEIVNALAAHMIKVHGSPVFMAKPEESPNKSYKMLAGKMVGKMFHDPSVEFDYEAYDLASSMIQDKAIFTDVYQFLNWDHLVSDIRYVRQDIGVHDIIIDPITCFTSGMTASETNEFLNMMSAEASALAKDLDLTIHLFCHLKAPDGGPPHERGGEVLSTQFAGGRGMMRSCNYMIGVEGNKDPTLDAKLRNVRHLKILEDREFGASCIVDLYWDKDTGLFNEM